MEETSPIKKRGMNEEMQLKDDQLRALIRPMPRSKYEADYDFGRIEIMLEDFQANYGLNLEPDFQRGHVWTLDQQSRFIESLIRQTISSSSYLIQFNCPGWSDGNTSGKGDLPGELQIIDGLQRLTAIRKFIAGEIEAFGLKKDDLTGTSFDVRRLRIRVAIFEFQYKADLLQYYIDINAGGTQHSVDEINRVTMMIEIKPLSSSKLK